MTVKQVRALSVVGPETDMAMVDTQRTVGELVRELPSRSRVFERLGIDYCCGGKASLQEACAARGLEVSAVLEELQQTPPAEGETDWSRASLTDLTEHIEATHHAYLRRELPRLQTLLAKVEQVHGARHPWLTELARVYLALQAELESHLMKEERILFPYIRGLDGAGGSEACFATVRQPIAMMEHEHDQAGVALAAMRRLTSDYTAPDDACGTFRALLDGLAELEADLHQHIHKENNLLHPRAIEAEAGVAVR